MDYFILIYYGFISLLSQLLIFRVLAVVFYGNELFFGVALSSWLFWVGLGSFLFRKMNLSLTKALAMIAFTLPLELFLIRMVKTFFSFGAFIGPLPMIILTFALLSIFCLVLGAIFPISCNFISKKASAFAITNAYLCESIGAIIAGLLFTFYLIGRFPIMCIALALSAGAVLLSIYLCFQQNAKRTAILFFVIFLVFTGAFLPLEKLTRRVEWKGYDLLAHIESRYQDIAINRLGSLMNLFQDGKISAHFPDRQFYEEIVHWPLLLHNQPKNILVGSGAAWGQLSEILKYDVSKIDYIELDSKIIEALSPFLELVDKASIKDSRVRIHNVDMRTWLKSNPQKYDVVILNLSEPSNLGTNRFYTKEFYQEIKQVLNPDGILAFSIPSAENYLAGHMQIFNANVYNTLKGEFACIEFLPGDSLLFLVSNSKIYLKEEIIKSRYHQRNISNIYVVPTYFKTKLSKGRKDYVLEALISVKAKKINSDLEPVTYHYFAKMWFKKFNSPINFAFVLIILIGLVGLLRKIRSIASKIIKYNKLMPMFVIGFMGIVLETVLLLVFQSACGFIYWQIGLLFASFMLGLALGSLVSRRYSQLRQSANIKIILNLQGSMIAGVFLLLIFLPKLYSLNLNLLLMIFPIVLVLDGLFVGSAFSISSKIYHRQNTNIEQTAASVYAVDLLGASLGPLLAGSLFIPLFGLSGTLLIISTVGIAGLFLFKAGNELND